MHTNRPRSSARERSERFETAFNHIHVQLKRLVRHYDSDAFMELLHSASARYAVIRTYFQDLKQFARLRNAIVHEKTKRDFYIAEPHLETVLRIEEISRKVSAPPLALTISTREVIHFSLDTPITRVFACIREFGYDQYPIYQGNEFQGLLTENGILSWISKHISEDTISFQNIAVSDVLQEESQHTVHFVKRQTDIFEIENLFADRQKDKVKVEAILITKTGNPDELPLGIITSWDLTKLR